MLVILILKGGKCVGKNEITDFDKYVSERYTTTIAKRFGTIAKLFNQYMCDNGLKAEAVTEQDIKDFISSKEKLRMTEYLMCSAIKCYGEYLGLNNIIGVDVDTGKDVKVLTRSDIDNMLNRHDVTYRQKLLVKLSYTYLFKKSDIINLKFSDIDFDMRTIRRGDLILDIDDEFEIMYKDYYKDLMEDIARWQETRRKKSRPELKYSNHVFRTANSIKLSISTIEQDLLRLGTNVKVLRDSGKVDLLKNGHTVAEVLELAGTDNYDAVIKLYKHVL